jgi:hypothetical protein
MGIFAIKRITDIDGSIPIYKMVINGVCEFDELSVLKSYIHRKI